VFEGDWPAFAAQLTAGLGRPGLIGQFMQQSELLGSDADCLFLRVPVKPLAEPALVAKVRDALVTQLGRPVRLEVQVGQVQGTTVAAVRSREQAEALAQAHETIHADSFVQSLLNDFDATIVPDSVQPMGSNAGDTQP
jgi:DNA polymerase-3 subunit gamma/tau